VVTGNGLKDPSTSEKFASTNIYQSGPELSEVLEAINKKD